MQRRLKLVRQVLGNMGWRYVRYRAGHELARRTGLLKKRFPTELPEPPVPTLTEWRATAAPFFFECREKLTFPRQPALTGLQQKAEAITAGTIPFFNAESLPLGRDYDWLTNPDSGYRYPLTHWTEIPDLSPETGDIKFVWEKSRFSYLLTLIRYDYHTGRDCADFVFDDIDSWLNANPLNLGPNYRCSQEISLRVLNWLFALYYYRNSPALTETRFRRMMHSIGGQMHHVRQHIDFSRIAVRNNHAITETLGLYLVGLLLPFLPDAAEWKSAGKRWFEEEVAYQVYDDGTFLQFSMNYHRVVVQLLTWAIRLSECNGETLAPVVKQRAEVTLRFLLTCQDVSGQLPNYGANDGAMFFPLSDCPYRDYRPQLHALAACLGYDVEYEPGNWSEEAAWYGITATQHKPIRIPDGLSVFRTGGYALIRDNQTLTFLRCGRHKDRPSQADNLHLDIWVNGENILRDAGSYKYNTDETLIRFFNGTAAHNTVMLGEWDQMEKGPRFIWFHWSQAVALKVEETEAAYLITGTVEAFGHLKAGIQHTRRITKYKNRLSWEITDSLNETTGLPLHQVWNPSELVFTEYHLTACDTSGEPIEPTFREGWYSSRYGEKEATRQVVFSSYRKQITTHLEHTVQSI